MPIFQAFKKTMLLRGEALHLHRANARQQSHRLGREQGGGLRPDHREPPRLVTPCRELGEQTVGRQADRDRDPQFGLRRPRQPRQHDRRRRAG